jgi:hypothetical protein
MSIEKHQFLDFLGDKGSSMRCPCCSHDGWHMLIHDVEDIKNQQIMKFSIYHFYDGKRDNSSIAMDVVVIVCEKCGFVRMHSVAKVLGGFCAYSEDSRSDIQ